MKLELPSILEEDWDTLPATVVPISKVPSETQMDDAREPPVGVWKHNDDMDDAKWGAMDVVVHKTEPKDLGPDEPHGTVAVAENVKSNTAGKVKPYQLQFLAPGMEADPLDQKKVGVWRLGMLYTGWPPKSNDGSIRQVGRLSKLASEFEEGSRRNVGELSPWQTDGDWASARAIVFPRRNAPRVNIDDAARGVWKSKNPLPDDWEPQAVAIHPENAVIDEDIPNGVWGTKSSSEPDEKGQWKLKDVFFYPPGETCDDECTPRGKWALEGSNAQWPPASTASETPHRSASLRASFFLLGSPQRTVRKLRMPDVFSGK
jgi:hypothetical protein